MTSIQAALDFCHGKLDYLDSELLIAHAIKKTREFVLAHPEHVLTKSQISNLKSQIQQRIGQKPLAYILGHKEFYGLDFKVTRDTLVPRPETEILVEKALETIETGQRKNTAIVDTGTGSGCIIISVVKNLLNHKSRIMNYEFAATDTSLDALKIAKLNAKKHGVDRKIEFLSGDLLKPAVGNWKLEIGNSRIIILANLPYLSKTVYASAPATVKKYEPEQALYGGIDGLDYYRELFTQIKNWSANNVGLQIVILLEFSPEQKNLLETTIRNFFEKADIAFFKDLCGLWRVCRIEI